MIKLSMDLEDFKILSFDKQYEVALDEGLFLYNYRDIEEIHECYSFQTFIVEIYYNNFNEVVKITSFSSG